MIGQETIERVRERTDIVALIGENLKLERRGRSFVGLCPFHKEKTPSFHVNQERGFYHCFGCHESGDAIKFVQTTEGLSFTEAIRRLAERAGIDVVETASDLERRQQAEARRRSQELFDVGHAAAQFFVRMLSEHPLGGLARAELERRGLDRTDATTSETLAAFYVGYAPYGWDALGQHLRSAGLSHTAAEKVGLLAPRRTGSGHYDRFRHRLMFAVLDLQGRVVAFSGRALPEPTPEQLRAAGLEAMGAGADVAKYVNSPESPIYRKREVVFGLYQARQALRTVQDCVVVEGNFDVVSLHARGVREVVAPLGTAFTVEQGRLVRRFCGTVTFLFDGDSAGRRAVQAARSVAKEAGLSARVAELPEGVDPDDLAKTRGADAVRAVIRNARGMLEYLIDATLESGFTALDARTRAEKIEQVTRLLRDEEDPSVRAFARRHADQIAARLGVTDATTFQALARAVGQALRPVQGPGASREPVPLPSRARSRDRRREIALEIIGALLDYPELLDLPELQEEADLWDGDLAAAIAALRQSGLAGNLENPEQVLAKMPHSIHPFALARLAAPRHGQVEDAIAELLGNVKKLKALELAKRKSEVVEELERAQRVGDFEQELDLLREQMRRARKRHGL